MRIPRINILFEDEDVLVINKPAGLVVHADGRTEEPTLVDWILKQYPKIKNVGDRFELQNFKTSQLKTTPDRSGIVHRLDRETSGALIIAKNQKAFWHFKKQFQKEAVKKEYHAFVYGSVKHDEGVIDRPIARSRRHPMLWSATRGRKGAERSAITEYRVLHRASLHTFLALFPQTGRTHQIRVHLKAINYPVVCDKLYAPGRPCALGFNRLALHARAVSFSLPNGKPLKVEAPYPKDFKEALKNLNHNVNLES